MELLGDTKTREGAELNNKVTRMNLPDHLLTLIAEKIVDIEDYIRFGAVCPSWRSVYIENKSKHNLLPLLLIPTDPTPDCPTPSFFSLSTQKVCSNLKLDVQDDFYFNGSTKGWLVAVDEVNELNNDYTQRADTYTLFLFNSFLSVNSKIELPTLTSVEDVPSEIEFFPAFDVPKLVLSANPISNHNYAVMAIYRDRSRLAFFKPGDNSWTDLDSKYEGIMDTIFYNEQFYVVNNVGEIFAFNLNHLPCPKVSIISRAPTPPPQVPPSEHSSKRRYIAELSGDLLQIIRHMDYKKTDEHRTSGFTVFKLDTFRDEWVETKSLDGHMLFLGTNCSVFLPASHFPQCKPNCIYFSDDNRIYDVGPSDMGVFNLKDEKIEPHGNQISPKQEAPRAIWIVPSL